MCFSLFQVFKALTLGVSSTRKPRLLPKTCTAGHTPWPEVTAPQCQVTVTRECIQCGSGLPEPHGLLVLAPWCISMWTDKYNFSLGCTWPVSVEARAPGEDVLNTSWHAGQQKPGVDWSSARLGMAWGSAWLGVVRGLAWLEVARGSA